MQFSDVFVISFLIITFVSFFLHIMLESVEYKFRKNHEKDIPLSLSKYINLSDLEKTVAYKNAHYFLFLWQTVVFTLLNVLLLLSGFYVFVLDFVLRINTNIYFVTLLFAFFASIPSAIISLPFELYNEFVIEKKFGFSTMTFLLWVKDEIKSIILNVILVSILLCVMTFVFENISSWWYVLATGYVLFSFLISFLYPRFISPLFNKFTPLEDGELKSRVQDILARTGFKSSGVFIMDASKRSKHSNAYFTGFGKSKRVVLFDTLVNQLSTDELVSVLAHELGHYKKHHIIKRLVFVIPLVYFVLFLISKVIVFPSIYKSFGFNTSSDIFPHLQFIGLFLFVQIFGGLSIVLSVIANFFSRKDEYEADSYAKNLCGTGSYLSSALIKLNKENNSELQCAKIYSAFTYSHPTLLERLDKLQD